MGRIIPYIMEKKCLKPPTTYIYIHVKNKIWISYHIMCKLCSVTHGTLQPIFPSYKNKTSICSWLRWDSYILILHHILHTVRSIGLCYSFWFSLWCYCNDKQITTSNIMHNLNHKDNNIAQKSSNIYITCLWFIVILGVIHDGPCNRRACECIQLLQEQTA